MQKTDWERLAAILICASFGIAVGWLLFRFVFPLLLPFLIAYLFSRLVRPAARGMYRRFGGNVRAWSVILFLLVITVSALGLWFGILRLWKEIRDLADRLLTKYGGADGILEQVMTLTKGLGERLGRFLPKEGTASEVLSEKATGLFSAMLEKAVMTLTEGLPGMMGRLLSALPNLVLILFFTLISGFYFCLDGEHIIHTLKHFLPRVAQERLPVWGERIRRLSFSYLRAYIWLLCVTVALLFAGLLILRVRYAFLLAIVIGLLDLLPVLGVGTVLIPWAVVTLFQKNFYVGFGLLILYGAVVLIRQIMEPRLLGKSLGVHPLLILFATFVGFRAFGFLGMLLAPFAAVLIKNLLFQLDPKDKST